MTRTPPAPRTGTRLGSVVLDECLGEIAGSWFYTGHLEKGGDLLVEVGLPHEDGAAGANDVRLLREGGLAGRLEHPNIAPILGGGRTDEGLVYVARPTWRGKDLAAILHDGGRLAPRRALGVLAQLLEALAQAHARGITHGNVRPALVALFPDDSGAETLWLTGFGQADPAPDEAAAAERLDREGEPHLLAPELLFGGPPCPATDVFQAALLGYFALVGESLVPAEKLLRVRAWHKRGRPALPGWLEQTPLGPVFARALCSEPGDRFADASQFLTALLGDQPLSHPRSLASGLDPELVQALEAAVPDAVAVAEPRAAPLAELPRARSLRPLSTAKLLSGLPGRVVGQLAPTPPTTRRPASVPPVLPQVLATPGVDPRRIRASVVDLSQPHEGTFDDHPSRGEVVYGFDTFDLSVEAKEAERARREARRQVAEHKAAASSQQPQAPPPAVEPGPARSRTGTWWVIVAVLLLATMLAALWLWAT